MRRRLREFEKFPDEALKRKQEGTVLLSITIERDGQVLAASVAHSSGFPLLDQAALQMVRDAVPLPPFPANYSRDKGTVDVPIRYEIGLFDRIFH